MLSARPDKAGFVINDYHPAVFLKAALPLKRKILDRCLPACTVSGEVRCVDWHIPACTAVPAFLVIGILPDRSSQQHDKSSSLVAIFTRFVLQYLIIAIVYPPKGGHGLNKKISRLLEPGMGLYFVTLLLFVGLSVALKQYYLAAGELVLTMPAMEDYVF